MKILILNRLYYPHISGGGEISVQNLAEALAKRGHEVVVAALNHRRRHEVADVHGVRVHYLPMMNLYFPGKSNRPPTLARIVWHAVDAYNPFMGASLGHVLDEECPEVVATRDIAGFSASVWRAVKKRGLPLVCTVNGHFVLCPRATMWKNGASCSKLCADCSIFSWPRRRLSNLADVVIGVSRKILERSCQYGCFLESEKVVVYNGFEPQRSNGANGARRNGILQFGYLGRLDPSKGVEALVRSFMQLADRRARLFIAGRGSSDYEENLKRLINGSPAIQMLGLVRPSDFLPRVDVLAVPSLCHDSAPRAVLEGMAYNVPVIGSCRGGIPELMGEGTGWIFDPDEPGALTRTMQRAINSRDELEVIGERAGERARQFSTKAMVNGYLKAFSCAIDRNKKNREGR